MATLPVTSLSEEQYLQIERAALDKSEFRNGQMFAMPAVSVNHSLLASAMGSILHNQIPAGCYAFGADLRIKVEAAGLYTYSDCGVFCGEPQLAGDQRDVLLSPLLLVEVLSPSTEGYDRGKKFEFYRTIEGFREYLIVHQDRHGVEHWSRQDDGSWLLREYTGPEASVPVTRLNVTIPLADLYASALNMG